MIRPESYARRFVKGSATIFTMFVIATMVGLLLRMFLARRLSFEEFGLFWAVFPFVTFFCFFREWGTGPALTKHVSEFITRNQAHKVGPSVAITLLAQAIPALLIASALFILSDWIAITLFKTAGAALLIKVLSLWFFTTAFSSVFHIIFQGLQRPVSYALIELLHVSSVFLLCVFFIHTLGLGIVGVPLAYVTTSITVAFVGIALLRIKHPWIFERKISFPKPIAKKLLVFALFIFLAGVVGALMGYVDIFMLTVFRSTDEVGLYQVALPMAHILWGIVGAMTFVFFPMVSELWAKRERKLLGQALHLLVKFSLVLIIPGVLIFLAFPEVAISSLFTTKYLPAILALQILSIATIAQSLQAILGAAALGIGRPIIYTKVVACMTCLNVIGNLLLIPPYGIGGAAFATLLAHTAGLLLITHLVRKHIEFAPPYSAAFKASVGGVLTLFLVLLLKSFIPLPLWPKLFVVVIPSLVFYTIWVLVTKALTKDDLKVVRNVVPIPKWLIKAVSKLT